MKLYSLYLNNIIASLDKFFLSFVCVVVNSLCCYWRHSFQFFNKSAFRFLH